MNLQCWSSSPVVQADVEFQMQGGEKSIFNFFNITPAFRRYDKRCYSFCLFW